MSILKIVFNDLKNFFLQKRYIFTILIISLIVASYSFSFFTAQSLHILELMEQHFHNSTKYYIGGNKNIINLQQFDTLSNWIKENNLSNSKINIYSEMFLNASQKDDDYNHVQIIVGTNITNSKRLDFIGKVMDEKDLIKKSNYALIEYYSEIAVNDIFSLNKEIEIMGNSYKIRAIDKIDLNRHIYEDCNNNGFYINDYESILEPIAIPYTTFIENGYNIFAIEIIFEQPLNVEQQESLNKLLDEHFSQHLVIKPLMTNYNDINQIKGELIKYGIIIVLALINIIALFSYWIDKNWRKYMIYKLCGAKNITIYFIVVLEALIISIFTNILGIILYYITTPLLNKIYISYVLNLREIIYIQSIIILLTFILVNINVITIMRKNAKYLGRR